ncbi:hypothetical protein LIER_19553 [Lithospermum erythrorhizon]|uniref:Uncharacterized protein n=1 Tax=Lithospermum erythrorhizon TaxID=34254 RepID=A0AAV3QI57_LITER
MYQPLGFKDPDRPDHMCQLRKSLYGLKQAPGRGIKDLLTMLPPLVLLTATISRSNVEVEYCGIANVISEACWLCNLLLELHHPLTSTTIVY